LPFEFVPHLHALRIDGYAARAVFATIVPFFLLPGANFPPRRTSYPGKAFSRHYADGIFRIRNANVFAANQIFDSIAAMVEAINSDSKLCACDTRHATENFRSEISAAQLGKGQGFAPPRCIPSQVPQAATETVPVSAPFGQPGVVAFRSWEVRP